MRLITKVQEYNLHMIEMSSQPKSSHIHKPKLPNPLNLFFIPNQESTRIFTVCNPVSTFETVIK